ncbi:MAG: hypothetical protein IKP98_03350 [Bacilli bacterium]|nr:hypothetical protein [Bacilli bacterium]
MKTVRYVKQSNIKDCASSCIYNIIRFYKGNINYNNITKRLHITKKGSSIYNVVKTLRYYKLESDAYRCDYENLINLNHPVIAYLKINNYYHYIIVKRIKNNKVFIFDPIRGDLTYSKEEFLNEWQSIIIDIIYIEPLDNEENSYIKYLFNIINDNKKILFILFLLATLFTISNLSSTYILKYIIDAFDIRKLIVFITIFEVSKTILSYVNGKLSLNAYVRINSNIRNSIYQKIFNLPSKEAKAFNLICRIEDLSYISEFIFNFPTLLIDLLYVIIIFIFFILNGLFYPYILLILSLLLITFHLLVRNKLFDLFDKERNNFLQMNNNLIERINLIPIIYKLKASKEFIKKESDNYINYLILQKKLNNNMLYYNLVLNIIFLAFNIVLILVSFHYSSLKIISLGDFYINCSLFQIYFSSIEEILNYDKLFLSSKNAFKRIVDLYNYDFNEEGNHNIVVLNNEPLLNDTTDNNIIFERNISDEELDKVKRVCLIKDNKFIDEDANVSKKEKIILARSLLSNSNKLILNNCLNNIDYRERKIILNNIKTEYNKSIIYIPNDLKEKRRKV